MAEEANVQPHSKMVPLVWNEPGTGVFADHAILQYDGRVVHLTFGQASPPLIWAQDEEEKQRQLESIQSIRVLPVIRLVMAPENFRSVAAAFQAHLALIDNVQKAKREKEHDGSPP